METAVKVAMGVLGEAGETVYEPHPEIVARILSQSFSYSLVSPSCFRSCRTRMLSCSHSILCWPDSRCSPRTTERSRGRSLTEPSDPPRRDTPSSLP